MIINKKDKIRKHETPGPSGVSDKTIYLVYHTKFKKIHWVTPDTIANSEEMKDRFVETITVDPTERRTIDRRLLGQQLVNMRRAGVGALTYDEPWEVAVEKWIEKRLSRLDKLRNTLSGYEGSILTQSVIDSIVEEHKEETKVSRATKTKQ